MEEDRTYDLPDKIAEKLLCSHCRLYISCGPVKTMPNGNSFCGRCSPLHSEEISIHNELFEASMSKFKFPCSYKAYGCNQRVHFGRSIEHENICPYRTFVCPSLSQNTCTKFVNSISIYKHFEEGHRNLVLLNRQFELDLAKDSEYNFLMKHNEKNMIIQYKYEVLKRRLLLNVTYPSKVALGWKICYKLEIIVTTMDLDSAARSKEYTSGLYISPILNENNSNIFNIDQYLPAGNNPTSATIKLVLGDIVEENISLGEKSVASWYPTETYGCGICGEIPLPPIYSYFSCENESIACSDCFKKITNTRCRDSKAQYEFTGVIKDEVSFRCRWKGCTFTSSADDMKLHTTRCHYKVSICPIEGCDTGYYLTNNVISHMKQHGKYCANSKHIAIDFFVTETGSNTTEYYFTMCEDKLIILKSYVCRISKFESGRCISTEGSGNTVNFKFYFVHDHCSVTSPVYTRKNEICISSYISELPRCFGYIRSLRGIFAITAAE